MPLVSSDSLLNITNIVIVVNFDRPVKQVDDFFFQFVVNITLKQFSLFDLILIVHELQRKQHKM